MSGMKVLISHPGFANFQQYFKDQGPETIFLHRNYDLNSAVFRFFRLFRLLKLLEKMNTKAVIRKYRQHNCDKLIVIKGCTINYDTIEKSGIHYSVYLWDSIKNIYRGNRYISMFPKVQTFDLNDSKQHGFSYLPLFHFRGELTGRVYTPNEKRRLITLYGSYSRDRVRVSEQVKKTMQNSEYAFRVFLTITPFTFLKELITGRQSFTRIWQHTTFRQLKRSYIDHLLVHSAITLDIANPNQSGMTTRTFESLSHAAKLVTNNKTTYHFCIENNIPVLYDDFQNGFCYKDHKAFMQQEYAVEPEWINNYCIKSFLNKIIKYNR